jgi:hypothetical protein
MEEIALSRVGLTVWELDEGLTTSDLKKTACYEILHTALDLDRFFLLT